MRFRVILPAPSVPDCPTMDEAFQLDYTKRNTPGNGSILRPVVSVRRWWCECDGQVGWHGPDARWERVLPMCLPNTIPSHARSLLREIPLLRPAARRRSAFPVPSRTSLKAAAKNAAQTSSGLRPRKHSLAHIMKGRPTPQVQRSKKPQGGRAIWTASSLSAWTFTRKQFRLQCVTRRGRS